MKVIDVSEHNGNIDYSKVKADGYEGVIIRAGYGRGNEDKKFTRNITEAMKVGMHIGIYWFSYAFTSDMAVKEAQYVNDKIMPYKPYLDMPVFYDWEYDSMTYAKKNGVNPDKSMITEMTRAFCEAIEEMGYVAGYYLNQDYALNYYNETKLTKYKRWFAWYRKTDFKECYLWQNGSSGKVNGINGSVDTDVLWGRLTSSSETIEDSIDIVPNVPLSTSEGGQKAYEVGKTYTVDVASALNVRSGPGTAYKVKSFKELSANARKHANKYGGLLPGTKVTCKGIEEKGNETWLKIPSGWICARQGENVFVK